MAKTTIDSQTEQQLKKLFVESLNGKATLMFFGRVKLAGGKAVIAKPDGMNNYEVFVTQLGASTTGYTYCVEKLPTLFKIHSSNSGDTTEVSYFVIGN
jgi:hypothetical protein